MGAIILQLFAHKRAHLHACVRQALLDAYNDGGSVECERILLRSPVCSLVIFIAEVSELNVAFNVHCCFKTGFN